MSSAHAAAEAHVNRVLNRMLDPAIADPHVPSTGELALPLIGEHLGKVVSPFTTGMGELVLALS